MRKEDLIAYARRDWAAVEERKRAHRAAAKLSPEEAWRIADDLRRHVAALRPDWPSREERQSDLATHVRVAESLRRVDGSRRHGGIARHRRGDARSECAMYLFGAQAAILWGSPRAPTSASQWKFRGETIGTLIGAMR